MFGHLLGTRDNENDGRNIQTIVNQGVPKLRVKLEIKHCDLLEQGYLEPDGVEINVFDLQELLLRLLEAGGDELFIFLPSRVRFSEQT